MRKCWLWLLFLICLSPTLSFSQEASESRRVETVMANTSNQFIYAFFGRDMLLYYLSDPNDISAIESARESDLVTLAKPFNAIIGKMFMIGLTLIYWLTVGYFILRLFFFAMESGWILQKEGRLNLSYQETRGLVLKVAILGGLAVFPVSMKSDLVEDTFYTNAATMMLFDLLGKAHHMGDESLSELVSSQRQSLTTLTLPAADSKRVSAQALNNFYTCLRLQEDRDNEGAFAQPLVMRVQDSHRASGTISVGLCSLTISVGIDQQSDRKAKRISSQFPSLGLEEDLFARAQKETLSRLLPEMFKQSLNNSEHLSLPTSSSSWEGGDFSFSGYTSEQLSIPELKRWASRCGDLSLWQPSIAGEVSRRDRVYYHHLTSRCMARDIAEAMVYPDSYQAMENFLDNRHSSQRSLALCVDQASLSSTLERSRFTAQYNLPGDTNSGNIEQIALDGCLANLCSASNMREGGMYACTNAMDLYETRMRDIKVQERGLMVLGFYMFDLYIHHPPSPEAKHVFNQFSFVFTPDELAPDSAENETWIEVSVPIPEVADNAMDYDDILSDMNTPFEANQLPTIYAPSDRSSLGDFIGYQRLEACVKNPLQIHAGYVCGNVPQEFSRFGMTVLQNTIALKTLLLMGDTAAGLHRAVPVGGSVSGGYQPSGWLGATRQVTEQGAALMFGAQALAVGVFDSVVGLHWTSTDEFGYLNTERMDGWVNSAVFLGFAALSYIGADSPLVSIIDGALLVGLMVGVVFAFFLPLFPMIMVIGALIKFVYLFLMTLIMHGFKLVDAALDRDTELLSEQLDRVWSDWLALLLKLPMTFIGVVLAWLMSNVIISHVLSNMNLMVPTNDGTQGFLDIAVVITVSLTVVFIVYNTVLSVINSFYEFTVEWVLGRMHNNPFETDSQAINWKDSRSILHMMGR